MYRKGAQDQKRAKIFARLIREITVAAKSGLPEPDKNPRLRAAISTARAANMPKDKLDRAIKRVAGGKDDVSCQKFRNNEVRLQLHALAYNLANFMRTLALP